MNLKLPLKRTLSPGFTLIEVLIVVTILVIILVSILVALKPAQRLADARDARRAQDLNQIMTGINECILDNDAGLDTCIGTHTVSETYEIVNATTSAGCDDVCTNVTSDSNCLNLNVTLDDYFIDLPSDPSTTDTTHTDYSITVYSNGMTVLEACSAENSSILISR
jgi:prepilin-type N-terminal cleavage/methylation domain-containing protein